MRTILLLLSFVVAVPTLASAQSMHAEQAYLFASQPLNATGAPSTPFEGVELRSAVEWRVHVRPSTGTFSGAGVLEAYYWTTSGCPNAALGCWDYAPQFNCHLDSGDTGRVGRVCGSWPVDSEAYNTTGRIWYVPRGFTTSDPAATLSVTIVVVRR
jgi:hypothetical protein